MPRLSSPECLNCGLSQADHPSVELANLIALAGEAVDYLRETCGPEECASYPGTVLRDRLVDALSAYANTETGACGPDFIPGCGLCHGTGELGAPCACSTRLRGTGEECPTCSNSGQVPVCCEACSGNGRLDGEPAHDSWAARRAAAYPRR